MRWGGWYVLFWLAILGGNSSLAASTDWKFYAGLMGSQAIGTDSRADIDYSGMAVQWIWQTSDRFGLEVEGHYGNYHIDEFRSDAYGVSVAGRLRLISLGRSDLVFTLGGGGLHMVGGGYLPWIGKSDLLAKFQTGLGFWMPLGQHGRWSIGYRFEHVSDPYTREDHGINYHCLQAGIYWDFF